MWDTSGAFVYHLSFSILFKNFFEKCLTYTVLRYIIKP
nr:MAG TPA: hypothetical protein [Caudoviricetes sp.]DAW09962.1 MAG TPA: hypothetical protein [Caudoviricetes sp.]